MSPVAEDHSSNPLSRKLQKILSLKLDQDPDLLIALKGLSSIVTTNNLRTRRNLRGEFERRSVELSEELCDTFKNVNTLIEKLSDEINEMSDTCDSMSEKLASSRNDMSGLLEKTSQIKKESEAVDMKREVIGAFIERYHITPQQSAVLRDSQNIDDNFFKVMTRIKNIHQDCKLLLQTHQTTGLRIMENMSIEQETAYQSLFKWTQNECLHFTSDLPEASKVMRQAMTMLHDRPPLYNSCVEELCKMRRATLLRMFINALTKGGPGGTPKPIELSSHDPVRYSGDMVAWLHQTIASERDFLLSLVADKDKVTKTLAFISEGVCRTLKIRVEQVLNNTEDCFVLLKICNMTQFYISTISPFIGTKAPLIALLLDLKVHCTRQFNRYITLTLSRLIDRNEQPSQDLIPTAAFQEALHLLKVILNTHDISVVSNPNPSEAMSKLLEVIIQPIVNLCSVTSQQLNPIDNSVYRVNTLTCIVNLISLYEHTDTTIAALQDKIEEEVNNLTQYQTEHIIKTVQLPPLEVTTSQRLSITANHIDQALCNTEMLTLHQCRCLATLKLRNLVWEKACTEFIKSYTAVYESSHNQNILTKTPQQIEELLA